MAAATALAVGVGVIYAFSPLTIWFAVAMWGLHRYATSSLGANERRWLTILLAAAVIMRLIPIIGLFVTTNHATEPFGIFFGDEASYLRRAIWLANVATGVPTHTADFIYAFDETGWTSHLYVLAFLQVLFGFSPYGTHLVGVAMYLFGAVVLFRAVRPTFGRAPAIGGLALLLFLPSLFAWSISALKEPLYFLGGACTVSWTTIILRSRRWTMKWLALVGVVAAIPALQTIRELGGVLVGLGIAIGLLIGWIGSRPRVLIGVAITLPIVAGVALSRPQIRFAAYAGIQRAARQHWGHVQTPGWAYKLLEPSFYVDVSEIGDMQFVDTARYVFRAFERYATVPWPWELRSRAAALQIPDQLVWYLLVLLLPVGIVSSFRRDPMLTGVLIGIAGVSIVVIAMTSGNVGTLIRHRSFAVPYLLWLSLAGACDLLACATASGSTPVVTGAGA
jgi:hypothetical protein